MRSQLSFTGVVTPGWAEEVGAGRSREEPRQGILKAEIVSHSGMGLPCGLAGPGPQFPLLVMGRAILSVFQVVRRIVDPMTGFCTGPSALQTPQNPDNDMGQWVRKENTGRETGTQKLVPLPTSDAVALGLSLGLSFLICQMTVMSLDDHSKALPF